eukprot:CAMPEP_0119276926 /NCGR_PEP_ID=MMETSP1329-20130426/16218_1 /TAXON_ID=114041 /ORGANISM="Genus nov. species nov., Strain RCC1024" /LENGTH=44 /DNA_ID= /DNA_START= /DNA_END= /DNA_ORIENTATION=
MPQIVEEGAAVVETETDIFFNPLQTLQRDLSVAALRAALTDRPG